VVTATSSVDGERHETTGVGYHDHNWGNVGLMKVVHDWYWARGQAGPYSVIASDITAAKEYGFEPIPIFMLARYNAVIGDDPARVTFERDGVYTDQATGKTVAAVTRYTYTNAEDRYVVSFTRTHDLSDTPMIDSIQGIKRIAARLAHFDGGANSCRLGRAAHAVRMTPRSNRSVESLSIKTSERGLPSLGGRGIADTAPHC
jgi:hypothetical protein